MKTTKMIIKMSSFIYNISLFFYAIHHQNILNYTNNIVFNSAIRILELLKIHIYEQSTCYPNSHKKEMFTFHCILVTINSFAHIQQ